jgi:hypothetical protein
MTMKKMFALDTVSGIQRDGTIFDKNFYNDGQWVRFQRGRPRKILGYKEITASLAGPSRGIYVNPQNGFTQIFSGYNNGMQVLPINNVGIGVGISDFLMYGFTPNDNNLWQFDTFADVSGSGNNLLLAHAGQNLTEIDSTVNTPPLAGPINGFFTLSGTTSSGTPTVTLSAPNSFVVVGLAVTGSGIPANTFVASVSGTTVTLTKNATASATVTLTYTNFTMSKIGVFTQTITTVITSATATIVAPLTNEFIIGAGQTVTGSGIPAGTTVVSVVGTTLTLSNPASASATITATFDNNLSVSGGIVTLHPYVFIYGNDGLIQNSGAGNVNDWVSATSNATNVATGKIVQALPVRGGSNAPSGLFWSLDSVIRVSYTPTTVTVGSTAVSFYWRYDIITSQSSILSAQCVIEYDGIYYWIGVDRFMLYNGVVKEIENQMNQNYFFDNLNYAQRQKVYATKVTRFGEVWWFYPRGDSTECNDAIIYNIREKTWYDAGTAVGTQRSAGYFSQVFHYPINADWNVNLSGGVNGFNITNGGSSYTNGTYVAVNLTGGSGTGAQAIVIITGGAVTTVYITTHGYGYQVGDVLSASTGAGAGFIGTTGSGFQMTITTTIEYVSLYQHEIGTDAVKGGNATAIQSYFETNDLGWVSGGPSQPSPVGQNNWLRIERLEPDFILSGTMDLYITGRPFAQSTDYVSGPYTFDQNTNKIDLKEQRRELRLKFVSNVSGGNYQLGRILIGADIGDVRGY